MPTVTLPGAKLRSILGIPDRWVCRKVEIPSHPGKTLGLRPLTDREVALAHSAAIRWCRKHGFISDAVDEDDAKRLADLLSDKRAAKKAKATTSGFEGLLSVSEMSYAITAEYLALALIDPATNEQLVQGADELRSVLERGDLEYLGEVLEEWQADRAPRRERLSKEQILAVLDEAKKGQRPAIQWNRCASTTLVTFAETAVEILLTSGGETSSPTTPRGSTQREPTVPPEARLVR